MTNPLRILRGGPRSSWAALGLSLLSLGGCSAAADSDGGDLAVDPMPGGVPGGQRAESLAEPPDSDPDAGIDFGDIPVSVSSVSSSSAELSWKEVPGASEIRVFIGPEPKGDREKMPIEREVARLPGDAEGYTLEGIAANTDVFVRIVAATPNEELWGIAHARTTGGARAHLDTPLRSVHAVAPDVLQLVLETRETQFDGGKLLGARGSAWQGGTWRVTRADGAEIPVKEVHRRSLPVGQPSYPVGFQKWGTDKVVDVDDHVFLVLGEPIGSTELLEVEHEGEQETDLSTLVPFSDRYLETPLIKVNQVGYNPRATERYAYLHASLGDGGQVDPSRLGSDAELLADARNPLRPKRSVLSTLRIAPRSESDVESGGRVHEIDLAQVPAAEGVRYRVRVPGVGVSYPTAVSEEAALKAFYVVARGMYLNRWCGDLDERYTEWSRGPDHCSAYFVEGRRYTDEMFPESTPKRNERPVLGGHHDAGDFDIRPFHVVVAQYLMRAFETNRGALSDGQLHLPESGNGIPDLLDEALWSLKGWEDLQNDDGSVRAGVESSHHPRGYYYADEDELAYWTFDPEPWHTAYVAALFAQGAHLVKPFDAERAQSLLDRAERAYAWAKKSSAPGEFLLYAASELSRTTNQESYLRDFEALWSELGGERIGDRLKTWAHIYPGSFNGNAPVLTDYQMGYLEAKGADQGIVQAIRAMIGEKAKATSQRFLDSEHAMRNGRPGNSRPDWGNSVTTGRHADTIFQALTASSLSDSEAQAHFDALSLAADYALGANPGGMAYVTGLGSVSPQEPLHTDSLAFIKDKGMPPMPGIPVYGPVDSFPGPSWYAPLKAAIYPDFDRQAIGLHHVDARTAVNMSEFTIWESQAPLTALLATLAPKLAPPRSWAAGGPEHRSGLPRHRAD